MPTFISEPEFTRQIGVLADANPTGDRDADERAAAKSLRAQGFEVEGMQLHLAMQAGQVVVGPGGIYQLAKVSVNPTVG